MKKIYQKLLTLSLMALLFMTTGNVMGQNAWINEFHYDNSVTSDGTEFVEIVIENAGSYTLSDFSINLYNGNGGTVYKTETLNNLAVGVTSNGFTIYTWTPGLSSIQNGSPDGFSLDYQGTLIQFLSYEGQILATDGPAINETSVDVGVSESNGDPADQSLQLSGSGSSYSDFSWQTIAAETPGNLNNSQTIVTACVAPSTQATFAAASAIGDNGLTINPTRGNGTGGIIILAKEGAAVDANPASGTTYAADASFGNGTQIGTGNYVVYNGVASGASTAFAQAITNLLPGTEYHFAAYEYNTTDVCYAGTPATISATTTTSFDTDSNIEAPTAQVAAGTISSVANLVGDAVDVFTFKLTDSNTGDAVATDVNTIVIEKGTNNTVANWSSVIAGAVLNDGTSDLTVTTTTVNADNITFDLTGNEYSVASGTSKELTLSVYLTASVTDGEVLAFEIPTAHSFDADVLGSTFTNPIPTAVTSNDQMIAVEATVFSLQVATAVQLNSDFELIATALDANGNVDLTARNITLSINSGTGTLTSATFGIGALAMTSGVYTWTDLQYNASETFVIQATDGATVTTLTGSITAATLNNQVYFSEYIEGGSNNKAVEIYNGSGVTIDLSQFVVGLYSNGSATIGNNITLSDIQPTLASGEVLVISNSGSVTGISNFSDITSSITFFNGDDALGLLHLGELIDVIGEIGNDPGSSWDVAGLTGATANKTLVRKAETTTGNAVNLSSFGTNIFDSEWLVYNQDDFNYIGSHVACAAPSLAATAVSFATVASNSMTVIWTQGNGTSALVVVKEAAAVDSIPLNGTDYSAATSVFSDAVTSLGNGNIVVYDGASATQTVNVTGLAAGTEYHVAVFEYNDTNDCYKTIAPAIGSTITTVSLTVTEALTDFGTVNNGIESISQSFTVQGEGLTDDIVVTAASNFLVSLDDINFSSSVAVSPVSGAVASTTIYAKFAPITGVNDVINADITISTVGTANQVIAVSGTESGNCIEPTVQATALSATVVDNNTIDLSWTLGNGDASLVLAKEASAVDAMPEILNAYTADPAFGLGTELGTGNFVVYNGAAAIAQVGALTQGTTYHFAVYAFNTTDNCYYLVDPALASVTTSSNNDADSDILAADTPFAATSIPATANAVGDAVNVFNFKISDLGTADGVATIVNSVKIVPGANNTAAWSTVLAGATLSDNTFIADNATITDGAIVFDLTANAFTVNDGADSTLTLSVYLNTTQTDGEVLEFAIPTTHEFIADGAGSIFVTDLAAAITSATHTIDVVASELALTSVPASVQTGEAFGFTVTAQDANGNVDTAARSLTAATAAIGTLAGSVTATAMTNGVLTYADLTYDTEGTFTVAVTDGFVTAETANITATTAITGSVFFSEYSEGSSNNKYVEIYNGTTEDLDLSTVALKQSNNGSGFDGHPTAPAAYSITLAGTLAAGDVYIVYNGQATLPEILLEGDTALSYGDNPGDRVAAFNGDDALGLFVNDVLVDLIGDPAVDPGSSWDVAGVAGATTNHTMVRKTSVTTGNTTALGSFGTTAVDSEWEVYDIDVVTFIGFAGELTEPTITITTADFNGAFGYVVNGGSSAASSYSVKAVNLTTDLVITAPAGFELSTSADFSTPSASLSIAPTAGDIADTTIYVRFTPTAADGNVYAGDITNASTGAATVSLAVSGIEGALTMSTIAEARLAGIGTLVKVTGVVVGGPNNDGRNRAIQDATAGITLFSFDFPTGDLVVGDSVVVEGTIGEFRNLLQLSPSTAIEVVAQGVALPTPQVKTINEIDESVESELVIVQNVHFVETGLFAAGNFSVANDAGDTLAFRIGADTHPLINTAIPTENVSITAWVGQFYDTYQLFTENASDIIIVASNPELVLNGADNGFDFGNVEAGTVSAAQSFTVAGTKLTADIVLTAPAAYELSSTENGTYASTFTAFVDQAGEVIETTVFVRFAPNATVTGTINGDIEIATSDLLLTAAVTATATEAVTTANKHALTGITAYPNPTNDVLFVDFAENNASFSYQVFSLNGTVLVKGKAASTVKINLSDMETGIYMLEITQDNKVYRSRIAKH